VRPIYETRQNREAERAFAVYVGKKWNLRPRPQGFLAGHDYDFLNEQEMVVVRMEIKVRTCASHTYDTVMISSNKILGPAEASKRTGILHVLAMRYTDKDVYAVVNDVLVQESELTVGGRYDRGDPQDVTDVFLMPTRFFRPFDNIIWS